MSSAAQGDGSLFYEVAVTLCGRGGMVAVIQSFFDESFEDNQSFFVVAGYLFQTSKLRMFEREWRSMLAGLPYFHMQEINQIKHAKDGVQMGGVYDRMTAESADKLARRAIQLISEYASQGFIAHVDPRDVTAEWKHKAILDGAYESCLWYAMCASKIWRDRFKPGARLAYFFEQGGPKQERADNAIRALFADEEKIFGQASYAFVPKGCAPASEAADILSFLALKEFRRQRANSPAKPRKDLIALTEGVPTEICRIDVKLWNDRVLAAARARLAAQ